MQIFLDIELQVFLKACSYLSFIDSLNDSFNASLNTFVGCKKVLELSYKCLEVFLYAYLFPDISFKNSLMCFLHVLF